MGIIKRLLAAAPAAVIGALVATNVPTLSRYLRKRPNTRPDRPKGVPTRPRSNVPGRRPTGNR